jgi:hypothetical protein
MKKILYLFLAVTIFACSSDDSSDNSNQTFFEKYNGVVWEQNEEVYVERVMFVNEPKSIKGKDHYQNLETECQTINFSENNIIIIENNDDTLVISGELLPNCETSTISYNVINNVLSIQGDCFNTQTAYRTTLTDPCE